MRFSILSSFFSLGVAFVEYSGDKKLIAKATEYANHIDFSRDEGPSHFSEPQPHFITFLEKDGKTQNKKTTMEKRRKIKSERKEKKTSRSVFERRKITEEDGLVEMKNEKTQKLLIFPIKFSFSHSF